MVSRSVSIFGCLLLALCSAGTLVLAETGCPPAETITPCICEDGASTRLVCSSLTFPDTVKKIFRNAARYHFYEVHIKSAALLFLPSMLFNEVRIDELYINNSLCVDLFEVAPASKTLEKLQLDSVKFQREFFFAAKLVNFKSLKTLVVNNVKVIEIPSTLNESIPSSLKQITLHGTEIRRIMPGAFDGFPLLDKLEVSSAKLISLTRDMFPTIFNVRFLYFDNNNISSIPLDLFTNMPELLFLSMKNNYITEIPEAAFGNRRLPIPYIRFDGNPLKCNCLLLWLIKDKPEIIGGTCHFPRNLVGKHLPDLLPADFNC